MATCLLPPTFLRASCRPRRRVRRTTFGPNMPKPLFRIVVEFWVGRGLPYKYSRDYISEEAPDEGEYPANPGRGEYARHYIREGL